MKKTLIFGHKNPDTDTICSAIAYAYLKTKLGANVEAISLGELNNETIYALRFFNVPFPRITNTVSVEVSSVILVDHNEPQQSAIDIDNVQVVEVIDHHRIHNFQTKHPLYYRAEPVGSTATILNKLFEEHDVEISSPIAGLLLSAIISDTLLFNSPTCTEQDRKAARKLSLIANVDTRDYGLKLLKAGADLSSKTIVDLITLDAKQFQLGDLKVEIAQVNAVDVDEVFTKHVELEDAINEIIADQKLDLFLFVVTDILNNDSVVLALGNSKHAIEKAYEVTLENNRALLKGVVSRKLQIVPILTDTFQTFL